MTSQSKVSEKHAIAAKLLFKPVLVFNYKTFFMFSEKWGSTKRHSVQVKQAVAPLMGDEISKLEERIELYDEKQAIFRKKYLEKCIFSYDCSFPYEQLTISQCRIEAMEAELMDIKAQSDLFEVFLKEFSNIESCRLENKLLKIIWDYVFLVKTSIDEWKKTKWKNINVEDMDMECKNFLKDIRGLDKSMRTWKVYLGLETTIKNMITSVRAIGALQNNAIRERHWDQLVVATKVRFTMSDDTTFSDLLSLNLHNFEDEVLNIVDKACKEMAMEKIIKDLDNSWKNLEFSYENHPTGLKMIRASEEVIENLEENQVQISNMMTSKYIAFFVTEISGWQKRLGAVDTVLSRWMDVQRTWSYLQPIFVGSEDIRIQLPEDSKRFDNIDTSFKRVLEKLSETPNVMIACSDESLPEELKSILDNLELCEKALLEYLETKRLAFPRFYFVSSADLLDILSNGNDPQKVSKHLTKLFDSIAKLKMVEDGDGVPSKFAHTMVAKDGEVTPLVDQCSCDGQVEVWLNRLMSCMRDTIRSEFSKSMQTYPVTARDNWIELYPAQVALAGTQIYWTTEVNNAFNSLEEGYESALKDYFKKQIAQLNALITMLLGNLTKGARQKGLFRYHGY